MKSLFKKHHIIFFLSIWAICACGKSSVHMKPNSVNYVRSDLGFQLSLPTSMNNVFENSADNILIGSLSGHMIFPETSIVIVMYPGTDIENGAHQYLRKTIPGSEKVQDLTLKGPVQFAEAYIAKSPASSQKGDPNYSVILIAKNSERHYLIGASSSNLKMTATIQSPDGSITKNDVFNPQTNIVSKLQELAITVAEGFRIINTTPAMMLDYQDTSRKLKARLPIGYRMTLQPSSESDIAFPFAFVEINHNSLTQQVASKGALPDVFLSLLPHHDNLGASAADIIQSIRDSEEKDNKEKDNVHKTVFYEGGTATVLGQPAKTLGMLLTKDVLGVDEYKLLSVNTDVHLRTYYGFQLKNLAMLLVVNLKSDLEKDPQIKKDVDTIIAGLQYE